MNMMRKAGLALAAMFLGVAAIGITAPANAYSDTNWPCQGCILVGHR